MELLTPKPLFAPNDKTVAKPKMASTRMFPPDGRVKGGMTSTIYAQLPVWPDLRD